MYVVTPDARTLALVAEFITPASHHDTQTNTRANEVMFLRRKQLVKRDTYDAPDAAQIMTLMQALPAPAEMAEILRTLSVPEYLATAVLAHWIEAYGTGEGIGLFAGVERYRRLEERAKFNAIRSANMFGWWGAMANDMQVGQPLRGDSQHHAAILSMHPALASLVFTQFVDNGAAAVMLARMWSTSVRADGSNLVALELAMPTFGDADRVVVEVPAFSSNSVRHEMVREPGAWHLLNALGLRLEDLNDGVAALLYNGGDLNSSAPQDAFKLAREVREAYPLLALLGGSTNGFMLGESNLQVSAWLMSKENNAALSRYGLETQVSAFDLLDRDGINRHTNKRIDGSPMPVNFESLIQGTRMLVELRLRPYASDLGLGALMSAVDTFVAADGTLGGQSARGYGLTVADMIAAPVGEQQALAAYAEYLEQNRDRLAAGLVDGTLTTNKPLFGKA